MNVVVTGALGHIGSALIHDMRPADWDRVVVIDNISTQRYCSLFNLRDGLTVEFVNADIRMADLVSLFSGADVVVHLAAVTDAVGSFDRADDVEEVNYLATTRVAAACAKTGARLLFASTTSVYGPHTSTVDEQCGPADLRPQSPYAVSKLRAEQHLASLDGSGLKFTVLRFGTVFGPSAGMRFHTAINKFCWQASIGEPISVWRTALHQRRPYLYIGDAVAAMAFIVRGDLFDNQVYNVVTVNETVHQIVEIIRGHVPCLQVEHVDSPIMNQLSYVVRTDLIRRAGFTCRGDLARGIYEVLALLRHCHPSPHARNGAAAGAGTTAC
jgi:UDP-glucose 4-epimerase